MIAGEGVDPTVTLQIDRGLVPRGIPEWTSAEPRAGGCGVPVVWDPPRAAVAASGPARTGDERG